MDRLLYTALQKYAHIRLKKNLVHLVGRFSKDFSEVRGLRSGGFQLQVESGS